jgi:hypothetical protein
MLGNRLSVKYGNAPSRGSPDVCVSRWRIVIVPASAAAAFIWNHGKCVASGSSRRSLPASRRMRRAVAVNSLVMEPMR